MTFKVPSVTLPFPDFKWRWMDVVVEESFNRIDVLLGITRAIRKCEGLSASSAEFEKEMEHLQSDLFPGGKPSLKKSSDGRTVLRRQGRYWRGLDLLTRENTRSLLTTTLGRDFADGTITIEDFVAYTVKHHILPNPLIFNKNEIATWQNAGLVIRPLSLILSLLAELSKNSDKQQAYITTDELRYVVVPLSIVWSDPKQFSEAILEFRQNPIIFSNLPDCASKANDSRMLLEHLLFLSYGGVLNRKQQTNRFDDKFYLAKQDAEDLAEIASNLGGTLVNQTFADTLSDTLIATQRARRSVQITVRPQQAKFRRDVLSNCGNKCIITGETLDDVLVACHIHEVKDGGSDAIHNGICLRADLHILYDRHKLRISEKGEIVLSPDVIRSGLYNLPNKIQLPPIKTDLVRRRFEYGVVSL